MQSTSAGCLWTAKIGLLGPLATFPYRNRRLFMILRLPTTTLQPEYRRNDDHHGTEAFLHLVDLGLNTKLFETSAVGPGIVEARLREATCYKSQMAPEELLERRLVVCIVVVARSLREMSHRLSQLV